MQPGGKSADPLASREHQHWPHLPPSQPPLLCPQACTLLLEGEGGQQIPQAQALPLPYHILWLHPYILNVIPTVTAVPVMVQVIPQLRVTITTIHSHLHL